MDNYNLLVYSDDDGKSWSKPIFVILSSYEMSVQSLDIQIYIDREGALHVCWVQNNTLKQSEHPEAEGFLVDGYLFFDSKHAEWKMVCYDPDAEEPQFTESRYMFDGFLRCKPTFLSNGNILYFNYDQLCDRYAYSLSSDNGKSFGRKYGAKKLETKFDESMAYEKNDGSTRLAARWRKVFLTMEVSLGMKQEKAVSWRLIQDTI